MTGLKTGASLAVLFATASLLPAVAQDGGPGRPPDGPPPGMRPPGIGGGDTSFFKSPVLPKDDDEKKILDDLDKNQRRGMMNVPMDDGRLLRTLTEMSGAKHVVERKSCCPRSGRVAWSSLTTSTPARRIPGTSRPSPRTRPWRRSSSTWAPRG